MISYREAFGRWILRRAGGFGRSEGLASRSNDPADVALRAWFAIFVALVVLSTATVAILGNGIGVQTIVAAAWGVFIGGTFLFYFNSKLLITIVGSFIGASVTQIKGVGDALQNFSHISQQITDLLNKVVPEVKIYNGGVFLFLTLVLLPCILAYGREPANERRPAPPATSGPVTQGQPN